MGSEIVSWGKMLFELGLAAWQAYEAGQHTKTVGEIFAGVPRDAETIERLREEARRHYAGKAAAMPTLGAADIATLRPLAGGAVLSHEERAALSRLLAAVKVAP